MITIIFILVLALLILGPKRLPQSARQVGAILAQYQQMKGQLKTHLERELLDLQLATKMAASDKPSKVDPI